MARTTTFGLAILLTICVSTGCNKGSSTPPAGGSPNASGAVQGDPSKDPIARVAYDFIDAVLKGDTQRASAQLTPKAMQRIVEGGKQFQPPGLESASFRIGEVRMPTDSQALVQCILTNNTKAGPQSEEMCCLMRRIENAWRVSGIACSVGNDKPPMILDFESPPQEAVPQQPQMVQQPAANSGYAPVGRPSPPRTAQEQPLPAIR